MNHRARRSVVTRLGKKPVDKRGQLLLLALLLVLASGCYSRSATPFAKIYQEPDRLKPGSYKLQFLLDGRDTLEEYLRKQKLRNPGLKDFSVSGLKKLFRNAYPQLYLPVQPGVPLCNLETNFGHCKGVELLADVEIYGDNTVLVDCWIFYHITLHLEGDQPNFFQTAKRQRDRGEFALPRHYYVGSLVETIQKTLPILREIATDYRKYIHTDDQKIEIELTLEESREKAEAKQSEKNRKETAEAGGGVLLSALPNISFFAGLTISALRVGGKTFWDVLKEEKEFDLYKRNLNLHQVGFSYAESISNNFSHILMRSNETPSAILIRQIVIRLRQKEPSS